MTWNEKCKRLLAGKQKGPISVSIGWDKTALGKKVSAGSMPGADDAIKIAKALGVPAEWLFDDSQDWPPPAPIAGRLLQEKVCDLPDELLEMIANAASKAWVAAMRAAVEFQSKSR